MQGGETRSGLLDEYDRLVAESQARISGFRELQRLLDHVREDAGQLTHCVCQLAHWRDRILPYGLTAIARLH